MHDELIRKVADLMSEQAIAYGRLASATTQLSVALVGGKPDNIEVLARTGEGELLKMRSRLLQITTALTNFAEARGREIEKTPLDPAAREQFELAARTLLEAARKFEKIAGRTANLALGGSSFATTLIQSCGIRPSTYRAPLLRYAEAMR